MKLMFNEIGGRNLTGIDCKIVYFAIPNGVTLRESISQMVWK